MPRSHSPAVCASPELDPVSLVCRRRRLRHSRCCCYSYRGVSGVAFPLHFTTSRQKTSIVPSYLELTTAEEGSPAHRTVTHWFTLCHSMSPSVPKPKPQPTHSVNHWVLSVERLFLSAIANLWCGRVNQSSLRGVGRAAGRTIVSR